MVFATRHQQVQQILQICNEHRIPLTPRGTGTGTTGATVPDHGGIILSLERMARILDIDPRNRIARVEPGVTNGDLQQALAEYGFFWPPDPTSAAVCTLGGNLAYNAAGPRAVKYGTPRENTLGLRAVTGAGEEIRTGVITSKGVVGYDLTRLIIGSEGTLGFIAEITYRTVEEHEHKASALAVFPDVKTACRAVEVLKGQPVAAAELMDRAALRSVQGKPGIPEYFAALPETAAALLVETRSMPEASETGRRAISRMASDSHSRLRTNQYPCVAAANNSMAMVADSGVASPVP